MYLCFDTFAIFMFPICKVTASGFIRSVSLLSRYSPYFTLLIDSSDNPLALISSRVFIIWLLYS